MITGATPSTLKREKLDVLVDAGLVDMRMGIQTAGDRTKVLRFRASADSVVLLGRDLEPLSQVSLSENVQFKNHERLKTP